MLASDRLSLPPTLDQRHCSLVATRPAFTGLFSTYSINSCRSCAFRIQWSKDSSCQKGVPLRPSSLLARRPVLPFSQRMIFGHCSERLKDDMDMIRHDHPRMNFVEAASHLTIQKSVRNHGSKLGILQPEWTGSFAVGLLGSVQRGAAMSNRPYSRADAGFMPRFGAETTLLAPPKQRI